MSAPVLNRLMYFPPKERRRQIMQLALPIIGGMVSQNALNLVDTAMVGTLGDHALAAVGMGSFTNWMAMAFITGLSAGVQAMAARRLGKGQTEETAIPLNGGLLLAIGLALPWSFFLFLSAPLFFPFLNRDPEVITIGVAYLQARLIGMTAVGMNFSFRGYWNGVNLSRLYMQTLIIMHLCNIFMNWVLIFGNLGAPALGATGAGIASTIATYIGTLIYILLAFRHANANGFFRGLPGWANMVTMLKISVPAGLQQFFFAAGMTTFFWIIGRVGTTELAASNVLINLLSAAFLPGMGFGLAAASLVGQALGRQAIAEAKQWAWDVSRMGMVVVGSIALPAVFFPDFLLGIFIHDPITLEIARIPLQMLAIGIAVDTLGLVLLNALLGAGDSRSVMLVSIILQWFIALPAIYLIGPILQWGFVAIWLTQIAYRFIQTMSFVVIWKQEKWATIKV